MSEQSAMTNEEKMLSLKRVTMLVYVLYAFAYFGAITAIVGIMINYIKREEMAGTWLESHCRWQMRTFWFGVLWAVIGFVTLPILIGFVIHAVNCLWMTYRVVKGWLYFNDNKPMPV